MEEIPDENDPQVFMENFGTGRIGHLDSDDELDFDFENESDSDSDSDGKGGGHCSFLRDSPVCTESSNRSREAQEGFPSQETKLLF